MSLSSSEQIREIADRKGIALTELAERLGISRQNLNNQLRRNRFTTEELMKFAKALEVQYESSFILDDGTKI